MDQTLRQLSVIAKRRFLLAVPKYAPILAATIASSLTMVLVLQGRNESLERQLIKSWFSYRGATSAPKNVTIVRLDNPAYKQANARTGGIYPRGLLGKGIARIGELGASMVLVDLLFDHVGDDLEGNQALAQALEKTPSVIGRYTQELYETDFEGNKQPRRNVIKPTPQFEKAAKEVVSLEVRTIADVVYEISLANKRSRPAESNMPLLEPLRRFVDSNLEQPGGFDLLNCYGGPGTLTSISFADLLDETKNIDRRWFENRVVLIGQMNDAGVGISNAKDTLMTACSTLPTFGVEVHGTIVGNLLERSWIRRFPRTQEAVISGLVVFLLTILLMKTTALKAVLIFLLALAGLLLASYFSFVSLSAFLPVKLIALRVLPTVCGVRLLTIGIKHFRIAKQVYWDMMASGHRGDK